MKSCRLPGAQGVEFLPENGARASTVRSNGTFQAETFSSPHCRNTSASWVASTHPARSILPSEATCASVASTGAAVITGEQIRTRRRALPIAFAMRWESASP